MVHMVFIFIMTGLFFAYARLPMISWLQIAYYSVALSVLILAFTYITASITVFFKDMAQIANITLQFGMWLTPIMWFPTMFEERPLWIDSALKINPVYYIVTGYRDSMLTGD